MWPKQSSVYLINPKDIPDVVTLQEALQQAPFTPCQGLSWFSEGFIPPLISQPDRLTFQCQNSIKVALKKEEKILPAGTINDAVNEKILQIEQEESRSVGRREKRTIKEDITDDLLPKALTKTSVMTGAFDTKRGFLLVNQASATRAESLLTKLRQALGGLEVKLPRTRKALNILMSQWIYQRHADGNFELDSDCVLTGLGEDTAVIRMSKQDLISDEVIAHLDNKAVTSLGLIWNRKIRFLINAAEAYIMEHDLNLETRFDVISIIFFSKTNFQLEHFKDAFYPPVN